MQLIRSGQSFVFSAFTAVHVGRPAVRQGWTRYENHHLQLCHQSRPLRRSTKEHDNDEPGPFAHIGQPVTLQERGFGPGLSCCLREHPRRFHELTAPFSMDTTARFIDLDCHASPVSSYRVPDKRKVTLAL